MLSCVSRVVNHCVENRSQYNYNPLVNRMSMEFQHSHILFDAPEPNPSAKHICGN